MKAIALAMVLLATFQETAVREDAALQQIVVTVRDESGRVVRGLRSEDFIVEEGGVRQKVASFNDTPDVPISLGIVIDSTLSMGTMPGGTISGVAGAKGLTRVLLGMLKPSDEVLLMSFTDRLSVHQAFTTDRNRIANSLDKVVLATDTRSISVLQALPMALGEVRKASNRKRALVLMSDAYFDGDLREATGQVRGAEVPIFTFVMRGVKPSVQYPEITADQLCAVACHRFGTLPFPSNIRRKDFTDDFLNMLSVESGGRSVIFEMHLRNALRRMISDLEEIAAELRGQYVLSYYSSNANSRSQAIRVRIAGSSVRAYVRRESPESSPAPAGR